jgi:DNA-binding response OmpR family regulator
VGFTKREYDLLVMFLKNLDKAFSRNEIISVIYNDEVISDERQLDHIIKRLRKKLLQASSTCKVETVWGYGYKVSDTK